MATADWDLRKLQQSLDKKNPATVYLLYGEETFLLDEAIRALKSKVLVEGAQDFNFDVFVAPEASAGQVRDAVETLPVLCERRLVIYKNIEGLKEDALEELEPLLVDPIPTTTLVLVASKLDKRKKFARRVQESGVLVELKKPYENQVASWIDYIAYLNEVKITADAKAAIQELVGTNLSEINNEVRKIRHYLSGHSKKIIELSDVLNVVSRSRIESVFNLTDAIGRQDRTQALVHLAHLLEQGQNEMGIVALIHRQIRILAAICEGKKAGLGVQRLSQKIGVPEFFMKQYMEQARLWDRPKIASAVRVLHDTDRAIKSSPVSSHIWLENFIIKSCQNSADS